MSDSMTRNQASPPDRTVNVSHLRANLRVFLVLASAWTLALASLLTVGAAALYAQEDTATLNGTITDPSGAAVPGATVTITYKDTKVTHVVVTNQSGSFSVPSLQPGNYSVLVSKPGFSKSEETGLTLDVAQVATLELSLKLGSDSQTVEVTAASAFLDTTSASLGTVIPEQQVTDLPLNGRQFSQLLQLAPGTVPIDVSQNAGKAPNFGAGAASPAVDGQTNRSNLFLLDGIIASNPFFGGFSFSPSIDAIQEFKAQSHTDQAEYGQATGAVVSVVSRSGSNSVHGAVYEFLRNQAFDSKNTFDAKKLGYHQNQFGASFGGPIKKDKLFYYANYEGGRLDQSPSSNFSTVPTAAERSGDFSGLLPGNVSQTIYDPSTWGTKPGDPYYEAAFPNNMIPQGRINTGMVALLNGVYPNPNQPANSNGQNNFIANTKNTTVLDQGSVRVDYAIGPSDSLNGRYSQEESTLASPSSLENLFETGFNGKNLGGTWVHTYSSTLVTEITGGFNNLNIPQAIFTPVDQAALFTSSGVGAGFNSNPGGTPVIEIPGYSLNGGNYTGYWNGAGPIGPMNIVQVGGNISKTHNTHSLKFGASYYHTWMYTNWNGNAETFSNQATWNAACQFAAAQNGVGPAEKDCPGYDPKANNGAGNLSAVEGGDPVASMLLSLPQGATRNLGNSGVNLIETTPAIFAQDSWRINPKFTLNYGLRWDYSAPMTERDNRLATYDFYHQQYDLVAGDKDLPSGALPANVVVLNRDSVVTKHLADFSPRLGFAYQLTPKTTLRMGAGRTFDDWGLPLQVGQQNRGAWPSGLAQNAAQVPLNTAGISLKPDGTPVTGQNPFYGPAVLGSSPLPAGGLGFQDSKWVAASSFQWNAEVERQLGGVGNLSVAYVGSHTEHQTVLQPYNLAQPSATPISQRPNPYPDTIFGGTGTILRSTGDASYESFQVKLTRPSSHGLTYNVAYTYSQTRAFSSCGDFSTVCVQDIYGYTNNVGPSELDVPNVFTTGATWALPFGKGQQHLNSGVGGAIVGGWQLNTILAIRSGTVVNPTSGGDYANAGGGSQRLQFVSNPESGAPHKRSEWWNPAAFAYPAPGTYGNAGINSLRGPGYWSDDLSLFRDIAFTERMKLQFRVEAFDVFNHPNLGNPGINYNPGSETVKPFFTDTITSTVNSNGPGANRDVQLALKLIF